MEGKKLSALIDYDFIVNTEFGLIRFIREFYQDEDFFDLDVLNKSDREILSLLYSRSNYNPLSIICRNSNTDFLSQLYDGFFDEYKKEIIGASITSTSIVNFIKMMLTSSVSNVSICVRDDIEEDNIKAYFKRCNTIRRNNVSYIKTFDVFYVKDYKFFTDNEYRPKGKNIYLTNRKYNLLFLQNGNNYFYNNSVTIVGKYHYKGEKTNG